MLKSFCDTETDQTVQRLHDTQTLQKKRRNLEVHYGSSCRLKFVQSRI